MQLSVYQIDAFTKEAFKGNPAAVVPLSAWLPDHVLAAMAREHNQSETAFFVPVEDGAHDFELRWFTPTREIDLCGHATLATSFVIFDQLGFTVDEIRFKTRFVGDLFVRRVGDYLELDFPARIGKPTKDEFNFLSMLNISVKPTAILRTDRDFYFVFEDESLIRNVKPDFHALKQQKIWPCITAPGKDCDFVSRFFTAGDGLDEDPVTGSTHCTLVPYWSERLGKTDMIARQLSERGGTLKVALDGSRVKIAGQAVLYSKGQISLNL